jgi:biotin carboxyl carrier protein
MTDDERSLAAIERAAGLLPLLSDRLERHRLGEIEVRQGDFRLRAIGSRETGVGAFAAPPPPAISDENPAVAAESAPPGSGSSSAPHEASAQNAGLRSPAVGFFLYADGLGTGLDISPGDSVGHVEMLGVRHEVRAREKGIVRHLVAESGEAVEYGQVLVEIEPSSGHDR